MNGIAPNPSSEGASDGPSFDFEPELGTVSTEVVNGNGHHPAAPQNGNSRAPKIREATARVSARIHERHPSEFGRRDLSVSGVESKLAAILKHKKIPPREQAAYLERVDQTHAAMCSSDAWQKDGGQFVKSLENWLAPTKERYDAAPESSVVLRTDDPPRVIL